MFGLLMRLMKETQAFEENKKVQLFFVHTACTHILTHTHTYTPTCTHAQFLAGMAEKIRKGIEAATEDLTKEKERKVQEEVWGVVSEGCVRSEEMVPTEIC